MLNYLAATYVYLHFGIAHLDLDGQAVRVEDHFAERQWTVHFDH